MHIDELIQYAHTNTTKLRNSLGGATLNRSDLHLLVRSLSACQTRDDARSLLELWSENLGNSRYGSVFVQSSVDQSKYIKIITYVDKHIFKQHDFDDCKEIIGLMTRLVK